MIRTRPNLRTTVTMVKIHLNLRMQMSMIRIHPNLRMIMSILKIYFKLGTTVTMGKGTIQSKALDVPKKQGFFVIKPLQNLIIPLE